MQQPPSLPIPYDGRDLEALSDLPNYQDWIASCFRPYLRGTAVEFGAGIGSISALLLPHVNRLTLVEPSANLHSRLQERFAEHANVNVTQATLERFVVACEPGSYDCAILVNVLEHIEDDRSALNNIGRLLRPHGSLLLFVPALRVLFSKMDERLGHFRRYHRTELEEAVTHAGYEIVMARYVDMIGTAGWWLINTVGRRTEFSAAAARLFDTAFVPLGRRIEAAINAPFGKNVVLVARRRMD